MGHSGRANEMWGWRMRFGAGVLIGILVGVVVVIWILVQVLQGVF